MKRFMKILTTVVIAVVISVLAFSFSSSAATDKAEENWFCAWGTAPTKIGVDGYQNIAAYVGDVTARVVITPTASGERIRIKVSNKYGREDLVLTRVTVSKSLGGSKIDVDSTKIITFNDGYQYLRLEPGKEIYSDPVTFPVTAVDDKIAISFYAEKFTEITTMGLSGADSYLSFGGDKTSVESFSLTSGLDNEKSLEILSKLLGLDFDLKLGYEIINVVPCLASLDVLPKETNNGYSVVVIGDSTVANNFPLYLAESIREAGVTNVGVAGKGIIGNSLLSDGLGIGSQIYGISMLERFDADALSQSGVEYVIVKIGANDIVHPVCIDAGEGAKQPTADEIIEGYKTIFKKCHDAGIDVIAVSITQWKGTTRNYFGTGDTYVRTPEQFNKDWKIAEDVNKWLSNTSAHDGYVDFVQISANPKDPDAFLPEYTIDGIHPSDSLQKVWADYFPLSLIGIGKRVNSVKLNKESTWIYKGNTTQLKATVLPEKAEDKSVKWYSSDPDVATVSQTGLVKGVSDGTVTITCMSNDGGIIDTCEVKVLIKVDSVKLNKTAVSIYTTKTLQLKATVSPSDAYNKKVTWSSSNTKVATVSSTGKVTAVGSGTAVITCKTASMKRTASCTVTVLKKTEVESMKLNKSSAIIYVGNSTTLTSQVLPSNATFKDVKWSTSDKKVAKVDSNGKVTAVSKGKVTITCTSVDNPMIKKSCTVKVYVKVTGVKLNKSSAKVYAGQTYQLKATVSPSDASNKKVSWTSSDTKIATVNSKGLVTAKKPGVAYITCKTDNKGFTAKCKITVQKLIKTKSVKLNKTKLSLYDGKYYQLKATVSPSDASVKTVTYKSSNTSVATVSSKGKIYAVKPGTATITCTTKDTGKTAKCVVTVKAVVPTKVKLNKTSVSVSYKKTYQLKATVSPSDATNKKVKWKSSDASVVYVNSKGVVEGLKPGKSAVITCTTVSGKVVAKCTVKVNPIKVKSVKLNKTAATLSIGQTTAIKATVSPSNATNKAVVWRSSNTKVATVNSKGTVKAVGNGSAVITCTTKDGSFTAKCTVQVKSVKVLGVVLNETKLTMNKGASYMLKATVVPENASNKAVTWKSSDTSVATVTSNGIIKAVGKGVSEVKVYTKDGNYIALCVVTVK